MRKPRKPLTITADVLTLRWLVRMAVAFGVAATPETVRAIEDEFVRLLRASIDGEPLDSVLAAESRKSRNALRRALARAQAAEVSA